MPFQIRILPPLPPDIRSPESNFWKKKNPRLKKRTLSVFILLEQDPYRAAGSERLKYDWVGLRSAELVQQWRLIFKICQECVRQNLQANNPIDCCRGDLESNDEFVNVIEISDHYA